MSEPAATPAAAGPAVRRRATEIGIVDSIAGLKTVVVRVDRRIRHPRYGKYVSRRSKYMAHDEHAACGLGDVVEIVASRPLSARKRWRVRRVVRPAVTPAAAASAHAAASAPAGENA